MSVNSRLARLLEHPALWRGRNAARVPTWSTGYPMLDAGLPGGGWPRAGLVEILTPQPGVGELHLLIPTLARLTGHAMVLPVFAIRTVAEGGTWLNSFVPPLTTP